MGAITKPRKKLEDILVNQNILTEDAIEQMLVIAEKTGKHLGTILLEHQLVTIDELARAIACQHGHPFYQENLEGESPPSSLLELIPYEVAQRNTVFPLKLAENIILVAVYDPETIGELQQIAEDNKLRLIVSVAPEHEINKAIQRCYKNEPSGQMSVRYPHHIVRCLRYG